MRVTTGVIGIIAGAINLLVGVSFFGRIGEIYGASVGPGGVLTVITAIFTLAFAIGTLIHHRKNA